MEKIIDAWIVGLHELPSNVPRGVIGSAVIVHEPESDEWSGMSLDQFEREYEWLPGPSEDLTLLGDPNTF